MSHSKFLANASALEVDVDGNILRARVSLACLLSLLFAPLSPKPEPEPELQPEPVPKPEPEPYPTYRVSHAPSRAAQWDGTSVGRLRSTSGARLSGPR